VRIIAGEARGFPLKGPPGPATRATSDKVRGAIFDALAPFVEGARVLDLYAGTGALGIEALSRGAASCLFVERAAVVCRVIEANLRATKLAAGAMVWRGAAEQALSQLDVTTGAHGEPRGPGPEGPWHGADLERSGSGDGPLDLGDQAATNQTLQGLSPAMRFQARAALHRGGRAIPPAFGPPYDIITLDPPYNDPGIADVIRRVSRPGLVAMGGFVVLEHGKRWSPPADPGVLRLRRTRLYGDTGVTLWQREEEAED